MLLLTSPFEPDRVPLDGWPWSSLLQVALPTLGLIGVALAVECHGGPLGPLGTALGAGAAHGGLLGAGWALAGRGRPGWRGPALRLGLIVTAAALAARAHAWGGLAYLAVPLALLWEVRRRPEVRLIGAWRPQPRQVALGLTAGAFLGLHLLVTASLTFGYAVRVTSAASYAAAVAYDVGANALSAEWLFRGALFSHWWRSWAFWPAAGLSTACALLRYLADPNLPHVPEVALGAVFYLALLGVGACALRALTGSLVPGYAASVGFFAAYRTLAE
jgi:hypothetical protein